MAAKNSGERALLVYLCGLLREAVNDLKELGRRGDAYEKGRRIEDQLNTFICRYSNRKDPTLGETIEHLQLLYGFSRDGYPYSQAVVARDTNLTPSIIAENEAEFFLNISESSKEIILEIRDKWLKEHPCTCGARAGEMHRMGCENEECPFCHETLWKCMCAYKRLKLGWGGRSVKEWKQMEKEYRKAGFDRENFRKNRIRPLTNEERRQWMTLVMKKGAILYGNECRFQQ
jgi:hypothetical protein